LAGAILLSFTDKRWPRIQEPIIGVLFVMAATGGIMLLANNPDGSEHLKEMLVGQILWVSYDQLLWPLLLSMALLVTIIWRLNNLTGAWFYTLFAVAITASVQLVGVYLVFASLIVPGLATIGMQGRAQLLWAYGIGIAGYISGLVLSAVFDLPSGPMVVWSLVACGLLAKLHPEVRRNNMPLDRRTRPAPASTPPAP
jgi:zinc/manganese transport system permease protein